MDDEDWRLEICMSTDESILSGMNLPDTPHPLWCSIYSVQVSSAIHHKLRVIATESYWKTK